MNLRIYGWTDTWAQHFAAAGIPDGKPARVTAQYRDRYVVQTDEGERTARISSRMRRASASRSDLPAVGDWVVVVTDGREDVSIQFILPRTSKFSRQAAGSRADEQVIAANVDTVWIVCALDVAFNASRVERYLTMVWESGATPIVVLTKADLAEDSEAIAADITSRLPGVPVHTVSSADNSGLDELVGSIVQGQSVALVGPSGVGKSTLVNRLVGRDVMAVGEVRARDGKGRHTTTHREIVPLRTGGLLLDTPGMRELQLWPGDRGLAETFEDIATLAAECRFTDCRHQSEPGCAVRAAIESGSLAPERLASHQKLQRELSFMERKVNVHAALDEKRRIKKIMKNYRRGLKPEG